MNVAMNDAATMLRTLQRWRDAGWLRALDLALARFIHSLDPEAKPLLLLATALLAQLESAGHTCLRLDGLLGKELGSDLAWPVEAVRELNDVLDGALGEMSSPCVGHAEAGSTPLVLDGPRLYLRRYWMDEQSIAKSLLQRVRTLPHVQANAHHNAHQAQAVLQTLFDPTDALDWQQVACGLALRRGLTLLTGGPGTGKTYTAARLLVLLQSLADQPLRVALAAPTGKAAARLHQSIESALVKLSGLSRLSGPAVRHLTEHLRPAQTLHSLLGVQPDSRRFVHDASQPLDVDVLIIDEASMVHLELMARVLEALPLTARLILLGDKDQLASVEAGSVLGDLCDHVPDRPYAPETCAWIQASTGQILPPQVRAGPMDPVLDLAQQVVMLRTSQRFGGAIAALAQAVNTGDAMAAWALLHAAGPKESGEPGESGEPLALQQPQHAHALGELALHGRAGAAGGYRSFLSLLKAGPAHDGVDGAEGGDARQAWIRQLLRSFEGFRVLSALREGPWGVTGLNKVIEQALAHAGLIRPGSLGGGWYEGRPVMVTRNDPALGVFNGDVGIALRNPRNLADAMLRVWFLDGEQLRSVAASRLAAVETAWAMTVHKSQGSEFSHTALVLPDHGSAVLTRELVYTGLTRARRAFTLIAPNPEVFTQALQRRTRRASGLGAVLAATQGHP
jgi:exodeoxyribonuclease V alpha subunit